MRKPLYTPTACPWNPCGHMLCCQYGPKDCPHRDRAANGATWKGKPIKDLSREELEASLVTAVELYSNQLKSRQQEARFLRDLADKKPMR